MKQRKKRFHRPFYLAVSLVCLLLLVGGGYLVYAAMTDSDRKENDFQVGQVETKIFEENFDEEMTETAKDTPVSKEVRIENVGTIKQFVRVMVLPEVRKPIVGDTQNEQVLPMKIGTDVELAEMSTADWIDGGDGYYYYKHQLDPKAKTSYLFKTVKLPAQTSDRYDQTTFTITLKVETVNCAEFAYRDAWWQGSKPSTSPLQEVDTALESKTDK
ncbi:hypothetical protein JZO70_16815 [Enterococcus sp. 669A]|uniref:Alternate signal-mediated exported protein n=1 Tax=Candidatus Enterococcus moelleringii TaxID=2815325 RepID=A0ABS3LDX9_9ENTE|nr:hypothetical protein [Enterococcus sp. 669A]MBO1307839.1 hypothetical protein [Enterococcus sp. 669A]